MIEFATILFFIVTVVGGIFLWQIHRPVVSRSQAPLRSHNVVPENLVHELLVGEKLSQAGKRDWLDRLLIAQQSGDEKK